MFRTAFILTLTLALTACATPSVDQDADNFDNTEFARDLNICRGGNILASSVTTIGKTAVGSFAGAGIMFVHGAAATGSAEAIAAGAAIGAVVGFAEKPVPARRTDLGFARHDLQAGSSH